jgi:Kef-type K+ transport system membrane component KefB
VSTVILALFLFLICLCCFWEDGHGSWFKKLRYSAAVAAMVSGIVLTPYIIGAIFRSLGLSIIFYKLNMIFYVSPIVIATYFSIRTCWRHLKEKEYGSAFLFIIFTIILILLLLIVYTDYEMDPYSEPSYFGY